MLKRLILLFITFIAVCSSHAQINVSFHSDCLENNSALLAQSLIESVGTDTVMELIGNETQFLLFCEVDSLGGILNFNKLISNKEVSKDITDKLKTYLINNDKHFFICYEKPQGLSDFDAYKLISKDLFDENRKYHLINVGFPGDLMKLYNYEKEIAKVQGLTLSKYEYLTKQIKKYLVIKSMNNSVPQSKT